MRNHLAFAALAALSGTTTQIQLLPAGEFRSVDGRPDTAPHWKIDSAIAARLIADFQTRKTKLVIDYEHQTLHAEANGQPAPAAGWITGLTWRDGSGLFATVEWTQRAKDMIGADEYRYISPVFASRKVTGEVVKLLHAALTNNPGLDGMQQVSLSALAHHLVDESPQETSMNPLLVAVLAALGLKEDTKPEDATAAINALKASATENTALKTKVAELEPQAAKAKEHETTIAALRANVGNPDPSKFVPIAAMTELQTQVAALTNAGNERTVNELVEEGLKVGKLTKTTEPWARDLGKSNVAALKAFLEAAPAIAALAGTQTKDKQPGAGAHGLTDTQLAICTAMSIKPEDYKKQLDLERAAA